MQSGRARYVGISNFSSDQTVPAAAALTSMGTELLIHQESYSMFERHADSGLAGPRGRGQTLAQLAIAWVLRPRRMTSALIGASTVAQLDADVAATTGPEPTADELAAIDDCLAAWTR